MALLASAIAPSAERFDEAADDDVAVAVGDGPGAVSWQAYCGALSGESAVRAHVT